MSLEKITTYLQAQSSITEQKLPPVELWDPEFCGDIDLVIKANGDWFYNGTIFKRLSLVKLFASVLKKQADNYYLVTPVEKIGIQVEDAPFVLVNWHWFDEEKTVMVVKTNLDDEFLLDNLHPVTCNAQGELYVEVRRGLLAKVHRNVYYQWVELAEPVAMAQGTGWCFTSAGEQILVGMDD